MIETHFLHLATTADTAAIRRVYGLPEDLADSECQAYAEQRVRAAGGVLPLPEMLQALSEITVLRLSKSGVWRLWRAEGRDEAALLGQLLTHCAASPKAHSVTWGDARALIQTRCLRHALVMPTLWRGETDQTAGALQSLACRLQALEPGRRIAAVPSLMDWVRGCALTLPQSQTLLPEALYGLAALYSRHQCVMGQWSASESGKVIAGLAKYAQGAHAL